MPDLEADVPKNVEDMLDDVVDLLGVFGLVIGIKEKDIDVAVGIEFAAAKPTDREQGYTRGLLRLEALVGFQGAGPEMAQHDGEDVGALLANFATVVATLMFKLKPMLFQLEKAAIDIELVGRAQVGVMDQLLFRVA
jgi:hypothetical protein